MEGLCQGKGGWGRGQNARIKDGGGGKQPKGSSCIQGSDGSYQELILFLGQDPWIFIPALAG